VVYVPYLLFPLTASIFGPTGAGDLGLSYLVLAVLIQGFSVVLGATYVSSTYGIRLERSLLLQLLFYVVATVLYTVVQYAGFISDAWRVAAQMI
jgi:hypothetical protein